MKAAPPIRVIPSGKVYRQIFDAEVRYHIKFTI